MLKYYFLHYFLYSIFSTDFVKLNIDFFREAFIRSLVRTCQLTRIGGCHPHPKFITHLPKNLSFHPHFYLFTRISSFRVFLSKRFEETLNKSSAINEVKCCVYHSNCESTLRQSFFRFLCKKG